MSSRHFAVMLINLCKHFHFEYSDENTRTKLQEIVKIIQKDDLTFDEICEDKIRAREWYDTLLPLVQYPTKSFDISCKINAVMCAFETNLDIPLFTWSPDD